MKIYFAGSIRGGREDIKYYQDIIKYLAKKGTVLTEHVGKLESTNRTKKLLSDKKIYNRDINFIKSSNFLVAEVTVPSLGVGYELGFAESNYIPVLCLYRKTKGKKISAMIRGNNSFYCFSYLNFKEVKTHIDNFINNKIKIT